MLTGQSQSLWMSHESLPERYVAGLCFHTLPVTSKECAVSGAAFFPTARNAHVDPWMTELRSAMFEDA